MQNMSHFHPLEAVGRGSDAQLQVGENITFLISAKYNNVCTTAFLYMSRHGMYV